LQTHQKEGNLADGVEHLEKKIIKKLKKWMDLREDLCANYNVIIRVGWWGINFHSCNYQK